MKKNRSVLCVLLIVSGLFFPVTLVSAQGQDPAALVEQGDDLLYQSDFAGAEESYNAAVELTSDYAPAYAHRCYLRTFQFRFDEAFSDCEKAVELGTQDAEGYIYLTRAYDWSGDFEKAVEAGEQAIALAPTNGVAHSFLGEAYLDLDRVEEGEREVRLGVELAPDTPETHRNLAYLYGILGELEKQVDELRIALDLAPNFVMYHMEIGWLYYGLGQYNSALEHLRQALAIWKEIGVPEQEGATFVGIGTVYLDLGQYKQALDNFEDAFAVSKASGDLATEANALTGLGLVYSYWGQYENALDYHQRGLTIMRRIGNRAGEGITLGNIALAYSGLGQYENALNYAQQALKISQEMFDHYGAGEWLNGIGVIYYHLGQYERALDFLQQALNIRREIGDRAGEGVTLSNIGLVYSGQKEYEIALNYLQQALAIAKELHRRQIEAQNLNGIAEIYLAQEEFDKALDFYQKALTITQEVGNREGEAANLNNIGATYIDLGQDDQALAYYQRALVIQQEIGDREGEGITLGNIGSAYERMGNVPDAILNYQQAINVIESIRSAVRIEELKATFASEQIDTYNQLIGLLWNNNRFEDAFTYAERARARALLDQLAGGAVDFRAGASAELIQREQTLRAEINALRQQLVALRNRPSNEWDTNAIAEVEIALTDREADFAQLLTELKLQSPDVASLISVDVAALVDVQDLLDTNTTLVEYFVTEDRILVFIISNDSFESVGIDVSRDDLTKAVTTFREFASLDESHPASLTQLHTWLIVPLKDKLKTPLIGIIPHGILHYLPFAALTDGTRYLSDEYSLFTLPSASVLRFIQEKREPTIDTILALGNPDTTEPGLAQLRFAQQEVETVAGLYSTEALVGDGATETALRERAEGTGIVHLAAHGQYNQYNPLFSVIYLTGDNENDGRLEVHEIYSLDLIESTDLVVLSACQTQLGAVSAGDEVVGLTRAFLYAGTPTVIASLWNVDDQATTLLMEQFYVHLREGMGKAHALRQAQSDVRAQFPHPYYWAAFVLTGDPGTVVEMNLVESLVKNNRILWAAGFIVAFLSLIAGAIALRRRRKRVRS